MEEKNISNRKPLLVVFAGPNGSGKSTITSYFDKVGEYTNADDMVAASKISNEDAAKLADQRRYSSIDKKEDFSFETVLSSQYKIDLLKKAKQEGYFIKCFFVLTIDPAVNIARVLARGHSGGHLVDAETVRRRYYKSLDNIKQLVEICDILHVYDNTTDKPVRIIRKHKSENILIYPNDLWTEDKIINLLGERKD